jgi:hypothetical protein
MTLEPGALTPADSEVVLAAGVAREALVDAIVIAALFNMITRLADSFGWHVPSEEELMARAEFRFASSYELPTLDAVGGGELA